MPYPENYPNCGMCGAGPGKPCTYISTCHDEHYDQDAGAPRPEPHSVRAKPGEQGPAQPFVAVKDEPNHYRGEPHTAQCGPDCPLPTPSEV